MCRDRRRTGPGARWIGTLGYKRTKERRRVWGIPGCAASSIPENAVCWGLQVSLPSRKCRPRLSVVDFLVRIRGAQVRIVVFVLGFMGCDVAHVHGVRFAVVKLACQHQENLEKS